MGISGGVNTLPVASNLEILPSTPNTSVSLVTNYTYFDGDFNPESGSRFRWFKSLDGINFVLESDYNDFRILPSSATTKGEYWRFEVTPKDLFDFGNPINSSDIIIINSIPTISNLLLTQNPLNTTDLIASWIDFDADNDSLINNITWYKNGFVQSSYNNKTSFNSTDQQKNDVIYYVIQVFDGENYSAILSSSQRTILNSKPFVSNIQVSPGFDTLYANNSLDLSWQYFDADFDPEVNISTIIYWYLDFNLYPSLNNTWSVPSTLVNKGDRWSVEIYVFDGTDYSSAGFFGPVLIQNSIITLSNVYLNNDNDAMDVSSDLILSRDFSDVDGD
ncbi:MAG: hypothetical protein ACW99A_20260, partial [Candidatus Kariarchaeaceae archaeon]